MISIAFFTHFFSLFSVCSLWIFDKKKFAIFAIVTSVMCAMLTSVINLKGLFIICAYFFANFLFFRCKVNPFSKTMLGIMIFAMAWILASHMIDGFISWQIVNQEQISTNGEKYSLYLTLDKVIAGVGILVFALTPIRRVKHIKHMLIGMLPTTLLSVSIIAIAGLMLKVVSFDPKFPELWATWIVVSLLVHCVAEEAIFRLFLQGGIQNLLSSFKYAPIISILVASIGYTVYMMPQPTNFLGAIFVGNMFFGYIFYKTQRIEASILLHFLVNFIHFFFFTYPLLNQY